MSAIDTHLTLYLVAGEPTKGIVFTTLDRTTLSRVSGTSSVDRHETKRNQVPEGHEEQCRSTRSGIETGARRAQGSARHWTLKEVGVTGVRPCPQGSVRPPRKGENLKRSQEDIFLQHRCQSNIAKEVLK